MTERKTYFADLILPLAVPRTYTYRIPMELNDQVMPGQRVVVQFGKNKLYTALVRKVHQTAPDKYEAKYIESLLDNRPIVHENQFRLWEWMAEYYGATLGEIFIAALPGSLRLASESKIVLSAEFNRNYDKLTEKEAIIVEALENREVLTVAEIAELLQQKTVQHHIKNLIEKKVVIVEEELKFKYKPKFETVLEFSELYADEDQLKLLFEELERKKNAAKRIEVLLLFIQLSKRYSNPVPVKKSELVKQLNGNGSAVETLIKNNIFIAKSVRVDRLAGDDAESLSTFELSEAQESARIEILEQFKEKETVLLHGVTGSGKTEVYIRLIEDIISNSSKQVLYLLPEIALTTQIIQRLKKFFGNQVGVYHSRFNEQERAEIWAKTLKNEYRILLGARSSLFLPFNELGLIIVDEEHESSFKQYDPAPRYNARDSAMVLASVYGSKVLLGSATPAIESFYNAQQGKYGLVTLKKRYGGVMLPEIQCVDLKKAQQRKEMRSIFSDTLLEHLKAAIENKEQVILFQNRRGYSPQWMCETCGWVPKCKNCDVSLTYHKATHQLQCHYCTTVYPPPKTCSACGSHKLKMLGFGTEKIEEDLSLLIPGIRVARLDLDSTRSKHAYLNIINDFEDRNTDVLIGTQMVTKGLDFDNVALVGILNADSLLHYPDFRAFERSYQLLAQVSGRAGRKNKRGKVLVQTYSPNHWVIQKVMQNDYEGLYNQELLERKNFHYPPFVKLARLVLKHKDQDKVKHGALHLANVLKKDLGKRILGPEQPAIARIRNYYYMNILIKLERGSNYAPRKKMIFDHLTDFRQHPEFKSVIVDIDVDPV